MGLNRTDQDSRTSLVHKWLRLVPASPYLPLRVHLLIVFFIDNSMDSTEWFQNVTSCSNNYGRNQTSSLAQEKFGNYWAGDVTSYFHPHTTEVHYRAHKTLIKTILNQHLTSYSSLRSATWMLSSHLGLNLLLVSPHYQMLCSHTLVSHSTAIKTTSNSHRIVTGSSGLSHTRTPNHNPICTAESSEKISLF